MMMPPQIAQDTLLVENNQFGEIIPPPAVAWSFDAPGWYALMILTILLVLVILLFRYRRYRLNQYRRDALNVLSSYRNSNGQLLSKQVEQTNWLLKRIVLRFRSATDFSAQSHEEWMDYLNDFCQGEPFSKTDAALVFNACYRSDFQPVQDEVDQYLDRATHWIKSHRSS